MKKNYLLSGLFAMAMTGMALISCTDTDEPVVQTQTNRVPAPVPVQRVTM